MSDGGPGFAEIVSRVAGARVISREVTGPLRSPVVANIVHIGETAYIESAECCGQHLVPSAERDPRRTTTAGVGDAVARAVGDGAKTIVVGLGGTSTTDAGAGALGSLGAVALDRDGRPVDLDSGGGALCEIVDLDLSRARQLLRGVRLIVASDVAAELHGEHGAARGYAPQKGASPTVVVELEAALQHFASLPSLREDMDDVAQRAGAGAAGGLGWALLTLGAEVKSGFDIVSELAGLQDRVRQADLVITGEGRLDWQSLTGKVVAGIASLASRTGVPVAVVAGQVDMAAREWSDLGIQAVVAASVEPDAESVAPAEALARATARLAAEWSRE